MCILIIILKLFIPLTFHVTFSAIDILIYLWSPSKKLKLSVPPIWIYIPSDAQLNPPLFAIFKSVCWYEEFFFILVLSLQSVRQKKDAPCYARSIHWKEALAPGQFSNRAILSHTMTGKNRHTSFVNRLNFKSCISHSVGFQQLLYSESALWSY